MPKKILFIVGFLAVAGFMFNFGAPDAKALTTAELQAMIQQLQQQITQLQQQIAQLQQQLAEVQEEPAVWCHDFNVNLRMGDSSADVRALRTALTKEGFSGLEAIGGAYDFDERLASVVVGFQEKYTSDVLAPWGLENGTGYVGPTTRAKLTLLYGCRKETLTEMSCNEKCGEIGFVSGSCGELHLSGETGYCKINEMEIGETPDCGVIKDVVGGEEVVVPGGILGCCCKL